MPNLENPFASPQVVSDTVAPASSDVEQLRKTYLKHEASIRGIGSLFLFGTVITGFYAVGMLIMLVTSLAVRGLGLSPTEALIIFGLDALFFGLAAGTYYVGRGLRKLRPQVRTAAGVFCALGLFGFPIGTLINGYFLYLLFGRKGQVVFSPEYQAAIELTPYLRYRTSLLSWCVLLLLILGVVGALAFLLGTA